MSRIVSSEVLIPDGNTPIQEYAPDIYEKRIRIGKARTLPFAESAVKLPDPRTYRSMSRAAILLSHVCLELEGEVRVYLQRSPFCVGVYCAIENGPIDFTSAKRMTDARRDNFAQLYKKYRNPKMYLKQLPNLAAAQMGIFLGILGPMTVYNHSTLGSLQALEQAEMDLVDDRIAAALVCSAFSFENPIILERLKMTCLQDSILCEGAGAMLLEKDDNITDWKSLNGADTDSYYGISHQLITRILSRRKLYG